MNIVSLTFGCERTPNMNSKSLTTLEMDPLAQPKSLQQVGLPLELTRTAIPSDNLQTPEKISVGQKLFFERRLSADGTISCSTCHDPELSFTDRKATLVGIQGRASVDVMRRRF
jgi:cytochrome c peroxidase